MKWRISDWPFSPSEKLKLHWMRSPRMVGDDKHWVMTAVFRRQNGEIVDVDVPWGMLPALHLGRSYQRGMLTDDISEWNRMDFEFPCHVSCEVRRAGDVLPRSLYSLVTRKNLDELCVRISFGHQVVVIPCIEVIRAFYCPNRVMAEAILTPSGLTHLVRAGLDGDILRMRFDQSIPHSILRSKYIVALIGQILTNNEWNEHWNQVWHSRPKITATERPVPLACEPPVLAGSRWTVLGYSLGHLSFVPQIIGTKSSTSLPFTKIWFSHPNSMKRGELDIGASKGIQPASNLNYDVQVHREPTNPVRVTQPVIIGTDVSQHFNMANTEIREIGVKPSLSITKESVGPSAIKHRQTVKRESKVLSFYEEGSKGNTPAGEFTPLVSVDETSLPDSMLSFFRAIEEMQIQKGYDVGFVIKQIPEESPISHTLDQVKRLYALVEIYAMNMNAYILEVDGQDGHSMSTLLYAHYHTANDPLWISERLFNEFVTTQGTWDRARITGFMGNHYLFARHRGTDAWSWGQRLAGKVNRLLVGVN